MLNKEQKQAFDRVEILLSKAGIAFRRSLDRTDVSKYGAMAVATYVSVRPRVSLNVYLFQNQSSLKQAIEVLDTQPKEKRIYRDYCQNGRLLLVAEADISRDSEAKKAVILKFLSAFAGEE